MESSRRGRADPGGELMEAAGLHFLDGTCGACDGISRESQDLYKEIEKGRVFAFDGVQAAISVIEGGTTIFCHDISSGLFNLGLSTKPRSSWRDDLMASLTSLLETSDSRSPRCPIDSSASSVMTSPSSPWGAVLHITPNRALVQQQHSNGDTEGLSFHFVRRLDGRTPTTAAPQTTTEEQILQSLSVVEDGYIIFRSKGSGAQRLAEVATSDKSNNNRNIAPSKRPKRDPNRLKGHINAYNFFAKDKWPGFVQNGPNGQNKNEINQIVGMAWEEATEQDKKIYKEMTTIDKRRYIKKMGDYHPSKGNPWTAPRINTPKEDIAEGGTSSQCRRPRPAYPHFAPQERKGVLSSGSTQTKTQMSKVFGRRSRRELGVPVEEGALYFELEDADKERYEREANTQDSASKRTAAP